MGAKDRNEIRFSCRIAILIGWSFVVFQCVFIAWGQGVITERKPKFLGGGPRDKPFNVTRHTIPLSEIQGNLPRDAIPALVRPKFLTAEQMGKQLRDSDRILGVVFNGEAKAYPVRILNWHELVNDEVGGRPILVSW